MKNYILDNDLIQDCVSGCLNAIDDETTKSSSVTICKGVNQIGEKFQVQVVVTFDTNDFFDDSKEEFREFGINDENRLVWK